MSDVVVVWKPLRVVVSVNNSRHSSLFKLSIAAPLSSTQDSSICCWMNGWMEGDYKYIRQSAGRSARTATSHHAPTTTIFKKKKYPRNKIGCWHGSSQWWKTILFSFLFLFLFCFPSNVTTINVLCVVALAALVAKGKCRGDQLDSIRSLFAHQPPHIP